MTSIPPTTPARRLLNAMAHSLVIITLIATALALTFDKTLPYRIGPSHYAQYLWAQRLSMVALASTLPALVLGLVVRRTLYIVLSFLAPMFLVLLMGGVHSGPNPEAWCYNNLRKIEGAKWQLEQNNGVTNGAAVTAKQISPFIEDGIGSLVCAVHGVYTINPIGQEPRCSVHGSIGEMEATWKAEMDTQKRSPGQDHRNDTNGP